MDLRCKLTLSFLLAAAAAPEPHGCRPMPLPPPLRQPPSPPSQPQPDPVMPMGPSTGAPGSPSAPGPSGPAPNGPMTPSPAGAPSTGRGGGPGGPVTGVAIGEDYSRWQYWWNARRWRYLRLRDDHEEVVSHSDEFFMGAGAVHEVARRGPARAQVELEIVPALRAALAGAPSRHVQTGCMLALAKIGPAAGPLHDDLLPFLRSGEQTVREVAALGLGIARDRAAIGTLLALAGDTPAGRALVGFDRVDLRTRTFAAHALGLLGEEPIGLADHRRVSILLRSLATGEERRELRIAAIHSLAAIAPDLSAPRGRLLHQHNLVTLEKLLARDESPAEAIVRSHVAAAIGEVAGRTRADGPLRSRYAHLLLRALQGRGAGATDWVAQAAVIALGRMALPAGDDRDATADALWNYYRDGKDRQAAYLALIALARIGGDDNRARLLDALAKGRKALEKPWAAVALGVLGHDHPDPMIGDALRAELARARNPEALGAIAIALGLARQADAATELAALLARYTHQDELAGHLCVALGLLGDPSVVTDVRRAWSTAQNRPMLLAEASIGLALLGDGSVNSSLIELLSRERPTLARTAAVAFALQYVGDRTSVAPLVTALADTGQTAIARGYAAVALGGIADPRPYAWNVGLLDYVPYRAVVETLTDGSAGVLDIF